MSHRSFGIFQAGQPNVGSIVVGFLVTVEKDTPYTIREQRNRDLAQDSAVRHSPKVQQGALVQCIDNFEHIPGNKRRVDETTDVLSCLEAFFGKDTARSPTGGLEKFPHVGLRKGVEIALVKCP
ncbi:hypothetical protein HG530_009434 [Fusarium avenaceum]|nr:hypothetical protein HG530_009434 [Fusarium avenaceum]